MSGRNPSFINVHLIYSPWQSAIYHRNVSTLFPPDGRPGCSQGWESDFREDSQFNSSPCMYLLLCVVNNDWSISIWSFICQSCSWSAEQEENVFNMKDEVFHFFPVAANLVSRDRFGRPAPRQPGHSPRSSWILCLLTDSPLSSRFLRRDGVHPCRQPPSYTIEGQSRMLYYQVTQLLRSTVGVHHIY